MVGLNTTFAFRATLRVATALSINEIGKSDTKVKRVSDGKVNHSGHSLVWTNHGCSCSTFMHLPLLWVSGQDFGLFPKSRRKRENKQTTTPPVVRNTRLGLSPEIGPQRSFHFSSVNTTGITCHGRSSWEQLFDWRLDFDWRVHICTIGRLKNGTLAVGPAGTFSSGSQAPYSYSKGVENEPTAS